MPANVQSSEFSHATQLFADKTSANAWRTSLTTFDATTANEGVVKQALHSTDILTVNSVAILQGASAVDSTAVATISAVYDAAEVKAAFTALAEKINFLTYKLEVAGIMKNS